MNTRQENGVGITFDVSVQYMVHAPMGAPKAVVMLFSGGSGGIGISPDGMGGVAQVGNNWSGARNYINLPFQPICRYGQMLPAKYLREMTHDSVSSGKGK